MGPCCASACCVPEKPPTGPAQHLSEISEQNPQGKRKRVPFYPSANRTPPSCLPLAHSQVMHDTCPLGLPLQGFSNFSEPQCSLKTIDRLPSTAGSVTQRKAALLGPARGWATESLVWLPFSKACRSPCPRGANPTQLSVGPPGGPVHDQPQDQPGPGPERGC